MTDRPTERLKVQSPENELDEIVAFAESLIERGERPWFEVWYPRPEHFDGTDEEWDAAQADAFDAVEYVDGEIVALPPYDEMEVDDER